MWEKGFLTLILTRELIMKRDSNAWKKGKPMFQVGGLSDVEAAQVVIAKDRLKVKTDRQLLMGLIAGLSTPASR